VSESSRRVSASAGTTSSSFRISVAIVSGSAKRLKKPTATRSSDGSERKE
jgi:hypothetical protein